MSESIGFITICAEQFGAHERVAGVVWVDTVNRSVRFCPATETTREDLELARKGITELLDSLILTRPGLQ
jgi:hypothetical protein